jgi:hypothetical protein
MFDEMWTVRKIAESRESRGSGQADLRKES